MSSSYSLWLNYDNDNKKYRIPVNPEQISIKVGGKTATSDIDKIGTLIHKGRRDAMSVSWKSFFPSKYSSLFCSCTNNQFKNAETMHKWILALMEAANPVHLVLTGGPFNLNIYAVITNYEAQEDGGDPGTINYSISAKEYRSVKITKYVKKNTSTTTTATKATTSTQRVNNTQKAKTYTIKQGDCLWNIAKKYYGNGAQYTKIYNANKSTLDKAAKKYGYSSCRNGNLIFPGTTITIP